MNTENYKNKRRVAKKMYREKTKDQRKNKRSHDLKVLEGMEEANKKCSKKC
jgi:hypothetical protein